MNIRNLFIVRLSLICAAIVLAVGVLSSARGTAITGDLSLAVPHDAWALTPIDITQTLCDGVWMVALALDADNFAHVVYRSSDAHTVFYAKQDGQGWTITPLLTMTENTFNYWFDLELDSQGYPHILYTIRKTPNGTESLHYTRWDGATWTMTTISDTDNTTASPADLALDSSDQPRLVYQGYQAGQIGNLIGVIHYLALEQTGWVELGAIPDASLGRLVIDPQGRAHLVFWQQGAVVYGLFEGSMLTTEVVEQAGPTGEGAFPELALDADGHPHVAYAFVRQDFGPIPVTLHYATKVGGVWQIETPDTALPSFRAYLTLGSTGQPQIIAQTNAGLHSFIRIANVQWVARQVDTALGELIRTATDSQGQPRIAYCRRNFPDPGAVITYAFQVPPRAFLPAIAK
jgi:predicted enzyme related to lactoylglutathione lyase